MKFVAAKCPNCSGKIKVDVNKKVYTCEYCRTDILLVDDNSKVNNNTYSLNIPELTKEHKKFIKIVFTIVGIIMLFLVSIFVVVAILSFDIFSSAKDVIENTGDQVDGLFEDETDNDINLDTYNGLIDKIGVLPSSSVSFLLNQVVYNLNTYDKELVVVYNGIEYKELQNIMDLVSLVNEDPFNEYQVLHEKDNAGYINKITINES